MWKLASGRAGSLVKTLTSRVTRVPATFSTRGSNDTLTVVCPPGGTLLSLTSDAVHPQVDFTSWISKGLVPSFFRTNVLSTFCVGLISPKSYT